MNNILDRYKQELEQQDFKKIKEVTLPIKESLTFDIYYKDKPRGGIILDIEEDSDKTFKKRDIHLLEFILDIAYSFYERDREIEYKKQHAYFKQLFNKSTEAIALLDNENKVININESFEKLFGYKLEEIKGFDIDNYILPEARIIEGEKYTKKVTNKKELKKETIRKNKQGELIPVSLHGFPITLENGQIGIYALYNDIFKRKEEEKKIRYLSFHDQLTGLYNRRFFEETIERLKKSRKAPVGVITADLDNLKDINDLYGHDQGDEFIKKTAQIIKDSVRQGDIVCRVGGDEFTVVLVNISEEAIYDIKNRIQEKVSDIDYFDTKVSLSLGVSIKKTEEDNIEDVIKMSDKNMYEMKRDNKNKNLKRRLSLIKNREKVVFEEGPVSICIADFDSNIIDANHKFSNMLGYSKKELKNKTFLEITKKKDRTRNLNYTEKMLNNEIEYFEMEKKYIKKSGEYINVKLKVKVVKDNNGKPAFNIAFVEEL